MTDRKTNDQAARREEQVKSDEAAIAARQRARDRAADDDAPRKSSPSQRGRGASS